MKHDLCRTDRFRARTVFALIGVAVVAVSATPRSAGAQATLQWEAREFQDNVFGVDDAVDIAYWKEDATHEWVYITGYQTTASGATVFATFKYDANDPGPIAVSHDDITYPENPSQATGTNRAVAIAVDPATGDVYVTGESSDPNPNSPNGLDYVTIKYDKDLVPDTDWEAAGHPGAVVRWDNPTFAGPGSHDRPVDIALGKRFVGSGEPNNVIGVTGRSYGGPATRYDIVTVLLDAGNGNLYTGWPSVGGLGPGARSFNGNANTNDSPAELDMNWVIDSIGEEPGLCVVVAGATRSANSGQSGDDTLVIEYDPDGAVLIAQVFNGSANGDDGQ